MTTTDPPRAGATKASARRFGLVDLMGLVVAVACGLGIGRYSSGSLFYAAPLASASWGFYSPVLSSPLYQSVRLVRMGLESFLVFLAPTTVMLAILRYYRVRGATRHLAREPGFLASFAVSLVALVWLLRGGAARLVNGRGEPGASIQIVGVPDPTFFAWGTFASVAGMAVLVAWATLWLGGRWRPDPSWIDRSGRVAATIWLAMIPTQAALDLLWLYALS